MILLEPAYKILHTPVKFKRRTISVVVFSAISTFPTTRPGEVGHNAVFCAVAAPKPVRLMPYATPGGLPDIEFFASQSPQAAPAASRIAQIPEGSVTDKTYLNSAFDGSFRVHDGWRITLIPRGTVQFAPEASPDDPVNACSRALFSSEPTLGDPKPFGPKATYFVFDPVCFPGPPLPTSTKDRAAVSKFAQRVVHAFVHTPYILPDGADLGGFDAGGRAFVMLTTERNVITTAITPTNKGSVHVNTLLMFTEANGYWVVAAEQVDDKSKKVMQAGGVDISSRQ